jgi:glycosyltransferase involved in cell wall biosynthesis
LRAEVVGHGIALDEAPPASSRLSGLGPYLCHAGPLEARDGCAMMIEQFLRYQREGRSRLRLLLVGRGRVELQESAHVRGLGDLAESEVRAVLQGARAVLVPARRQALAPLALEGWRESRPVLASSAGSLMQAMLGRVGGGLACRGYDELAAALDLLEEEPALGRALGGQGRACVEAEHGLARVLDRCEEVLARVGASQRTAA